MRIPLNRLIVTVVCGALPAAAWAQPGDGAADAGWLSIAPPLLAILVALLLRSVIPALFLGIWLGAWIVAGLDFAGLWRGLLDAFSVFVLDAFADRDHAAVMLFSFMIGGLVGIISRNGGTHGIVERIVRWADDRRRGQLATAILGLIVFIDDYANTLIVGNTMRPVTDRLRISREKLAYLVDSTAAPVAAVALVTTWIGYEVGLIGEAAARIESLDASPYLLFLNSIAYSFYPWLAIFLVFWICWTGRDLGPMKLAEEQAAAGRQPPDPAPAGDPYPNVPRRARNAVIPIAVLVVGVVVGLLATGQGDSLREIIGSADSYRALMWGSLVAVLVAIGLSLAQRLLPLGELIEAWADGVRSMLFAMVILVLAWALSATTAELGTAHFLVSVLGDSLPAGLLPALVFVIAAATAFATGTSWGTMGILFPLIVPLSWSLSQSAGIVDGHLLHSSIAAVLAGAVWGDHCSPISDTTILSSMASGCDHIEHVRTQLPYALLAGLTALAVGVLPSGYGLPWWLSLPAGAVVLTVALRILGRRTESAAVPPAGLQSAAAGRRSRAV